MRFAVELKPRSGGLERRTRRLEARGAGNAVWLRLGTRFVTHTNGLFLILGCRAAHGVRADRQLLDRGILPHFLRAGFRGKVFVRRVRVLHNGYFMHFQIKNREKRTKAPSNAENRMENPPPGRAVQAAFALAERGAQSSNDMLAKTQLSGPQR